MASSTGPVDAVLDRELAAGLGRLPRFDLDDLAGSRQELHELLAGTSGPGPGVRVREQVLADPSGHEVAVRVLDDGEGESRPVVLHLHGGGFVLGDPVMDDVVNASLVRHLGVVVVSPRYRLAPEHPWPAAADDCWAALSAVVADAPALGVDPARTALLGSSAGGCLAAGLALRARAAGGPAVVLQALLEPVLDDRGATASMRAATATVLWDRERSRRSWELYLAGAEPTEVAAPARAADLRGLPPTYLTVNALDPLRDEGLEHARRLMLADVPTELHGWPGAHHGFGFTRSGVSHRARLALREVLARALGILLPRR